MKNKNNIKELEGKFKRMWMYWIYNELNESKQLKFFALNNLPNMESRAKAIIDKISNGTIKTS